MHNRMAPSLAFARGPCHDSWFPAAGSVFLECRAASLMPEGQPVDQPAATTEAPPPGDGEMHWYVLKVQSNRERSIRDSLLRRIRQEGLEDFFGEIVIPTEKVVETKG